MVADGSSHPAPAGAINRGGIPHDGMLRCAYAALAAARCDLASCRTYVGWQLDLDAEPELADQRERGASFDWVAVGHSPVRMFDLHAGVVCTGSDVFVGLHAHRRLGAVPSIERALADENVTRTYSETVDEQQYNYPIQRVEDADWELLARQLTHCIDLLPSLAEEVSHAQP